MKVYLITYDLNNTSKDYTGLYDAIQGYSKWWHFIRSSWLIACDDSSAEIQKNLKLHIDDDDNLLIIQVNKNYSGWLPSKAWEWIGEHVTNN